MGFLGQMEEKEECYSNYINNKEIYLFPLGEDIIIPIKCNK